MSEKQKITLTVNGVKYIKYVPPRKLLVDLLRDDLELLGTHAGCEHGVCGSCTMEKLPVPVSCLQCRPMELKL